MKQTQKRNQVNTAKKQQEELITEYCVKMKLIQQRNSRKSEQQSIGIKSKHKSLHEANTKKTQS